MPLKINHNILGYLVFHLKKIAVRNVLGAIKYTFKRLENFAGAIPYSNGEFLAKTIVSYFYRIIEMKLAP